MIFSIMAMAQEIKVKSFEELTNDLEARVHPRQDMNGEDCALLKISIPALKDLKFSGMVIGQEYTPGEYKVYVPRGTKKVKFRHEKYLPGEIVFPNPAESKVVYRVVLELPAPTKTHVTDANAKMEEARKLFENRKYKDAKVAYDGATYAKDITSDQKSVCINQMQLCDSCSYYTKIVNGAYKEMKANETMDQAAAVEYANIAIQAMKNLYILNTSDFYKTKIEELENFVKTMPLSIRFNVVKWIRNVSGAREGGPLASVEAWAVYDRTPKTNEYENSKDFLRFTTLNASTCILMGTSNAEGVIDVNMDRNKLPTAIIFAYKTTTKNQKNAIYDMSEIKAEAANTFKKRQIRIKMLSVE